MGQKVAIFGKYLYVDSVDEIFRPHPHIPHMHIIRMNRIFHIRMANPNYWPNTGLIGGFLVAFVK